METPIAPVPPVVPVARKNNPLALWAGILGLGSIGVSLVGLLFNLLVPVVGIFICCGLALLMNLTALVLGIIGLVQLRSRPEQTGKGWAITGIAFGALTLLLICLSPIIGTAILTLLGPVIGDVFSKINNSLLTPVP